MEALYNPEYVFKHIGNNTYVRKCFGIEVAACKMEEYLDGSTHTTVSAALQIRGTPLPPTRLSIESSVHAAWIALRFLAPGIACKVCKLPSPDDIFALCYSVPSSAQEAQIWAEETVFFTDSISTMKEVHRSLIEGHWWNPSSNHYVAELHISPSEHGWNLCLSLDHVAFDARGVFSMMDYFLKFLVAELGGRAGSSASTKWGTEIVRLQSPAPFIKSIIETGRVPDITSNTESVKEDNAKQESEAFESVKSWTYLLGPRLVGRKGDISHTVTFSRETTAKLHSAAKKHGRTITQIFAAFYVLAHTEMALYTASIQSKERFLEVSGPFKSATHYTIPTPLSQRHRLPGGYDSFESHAGAPLITLDGLSLVIPMEAIRSLFKIDEESSSVSRIFNGNDFWDGLVSAIASAINNSDHSLEAYLERDIGTDVANRTFSASDHHYPAIFVSSLGSLEQLGLLTDFLPQTESSLIVEEIAIGVRCRFPMIATQLYEYDGKLYSLIATAGEYTTEEALQRQANILENWVEAVITGM